MRRALVCVALAAAGCPLSPSSVGTTHPSGASSSGAAPSAPSGDGKIAMPNLIGKTPDEARAIVQAQGFTSEPEANTTPLECENAAHDDGKVNCQSPEAGTSVDKHALIHINVYQVQTHPGQLVRSQLESLLGLPIEQAKLQLKKMGHDGEVAIAPEQVFVKNCGLDKVCEVEPSSGTGVHDLVRLYVNPKVDIALPPPD